MCKFYFTNRVVDHCSKLSLPNWVVTAVILRFLKQDLISIGNIRILYMIFERKYMELEVEARFRE